MHCKHYANIIASLVAISIFVLSPSTASAQASQDVVVAKIKSIDLQIQTSLPPNLVVRATGEVPTSGYSNFRLNRVQYVIPPKDGIQDYFFFAESPTGDVNEEPRDVFAHNTWRNYPKWVKGVRVHGVDDGVMEKLFSDKTRIQFGHGDSNDSSQSAYGKVVYFHCGSTSGINFRLDSMPSSLASFRILPSEDFAAAMSTIVSNALTRECELFVRFKMPEAGTNYSVVTEVSVQGD